MPRTGLDGVFVVTAIEWTHSRISAGWEHVIQAVPGI